MKTENSPSLPSGFTWITVPANGMVFDVLTAGAEDSTPVVLLHGFPEFADAWIGVMNRLVEAGYRCIAIQQRGYSSGARPNAVKDYAPSHLISDVLTITDTLNANRFHLIGHDWGGFLAWMIAARHANRLLSLVVLSTPHVDAFLEARKNDAEQKRMSRYITLFRPPGHIAEFVLLAQGAKRLRAAYSGKVAEPQLSEYISRLAQGGTLTAGINWYRALDTKMRLGAIQTTPTLFIWGDKDQALGRTAATNTDRFVKSLYHFEILHGYSHWLLEEAPSVCADRCLKFWDSLRFDKDSTSAPY